MPATTEPLPSRAFTLDTSRLPLNVVNIRGRCTVEEIERVMTELAGAVEDADRAVGVLFDTRGMVTSSFTARHRKAVADGLRRHREATPRVRYANALVVKDTLVRGIVTAIMWVSASKGETKICANAAEGEAFLREFLGRDGRRSSRP